MCNFLALAVATSEFYLKITVPRKVIVLFPLCQSLKSPLRVLGIASVCSTSHIPVPLPDSDWSVGASTGLPGAGDFPGRSPTAPSLSPPPVVGVVGPRRGSVRRVKPSVFYLLSQGFLRTLPGVWLPFSNSKDALHLLLDYMYTSSSRIRTVSYWAISRYF